MGAKDPKASITAQNAMRPIERNIVNLTRGGIVCERVLVADQPMHRMPGLISRHMLPAGEGLLVMPAPSIHTAFMRFPIDVIFLDRELRVVKLVERLRPWRVAAARGASAALELAAGEVARRAIAAGDVLDVVDEWDMLAGADHRATTQDALIATD
jgi:hypothetical protein